jgi:hypothetical protein
MILFIVILFIVGDSCDLGDSFRLSFCPYENAVCGIGVRLWMHYKGLRYLM